MKIKESPARDLLRLIIWFPFRWLVGFVSVDRAFFLFKFLGDLHFHASRGRVEQLAGILDRTLNLGKKESLETVRKYLENHYLDRLHIFLYRRLKSREAVERFVFLENLSVIDRAREAGRGVLLVQPHFGPVQISLLTLALMGYEPLQIGYPSDRGLSFIGRHVALKYRLKYEGMLPAVIHGADRYLGPVYKNLRRGGVVLTTGDGAGGGVYLGRHEEFPFLGRKRLFPLGPASLALRAGVDYVPTFIIAEEYNRFRIVFEEPIETEENDIGKREKDMTEKYVALMEEYVKRHPQCWHFWDEMES